MKRRRKQQQWPLMIIYKAGNNKAAEIAQVQVFPLIPAEREKERREGSE